MRSGVLQREAGEGSRLLFSREEGEGNGALIKMKACVIVEMRWGSDRRNYSAWDRTCITRPHQSVQKILEYFKDKDNRIL